MKITDKMRSVVEIVGCKYQFREEGDRIIKELAPLILEEAAKRAENTWDGDKPHPIGLHIASAIRALKVQP